MFKIIENGDSMLINDFNQDTGGISFKSSEYVRRHLVALEKRLERAIDANGQMEKNSEGLERYKDFKGNYIDNPDEYNP